MVVELATHLASLNNCEKVVLIENDTEKMYKQLLLYNIIKYSSTVIDEISRARTGYVHPLKKIKYATDYSDYKVFNFVRPGDVVFTYALSMCD